jgi:hypothetical protein
MWRIWEPVDGVDVAADRGGPALGPSTSVAVLEKVYEPDDAALRKLLRLLKEVGR